MRKDQRFVIRCSTLAPMVLAVAALMSVSVLSSCSSSSAERTAVKASAGGVTIPPPTVSPNAVSAPPGPRQASITSDRQAPFSSSDFTVENHYSGPFDQKWVDVFAGEKRAADGSSLGGGVRVYFSPLDPSASANPPGTGFQYVGEFLAPATPGPLSISDVSGASVHLQRSDGSEITFDLTTDTFTSLPTTSTGPPTTSTGPPTTSTGPPTTSTGPPTTSS